MISESLEKCLLFKYCFTFRGVYLVRIVDIVDKLAYLFINNLKFFSESKTSNSFLKVTHHSCQINWKALGDKNIKLVGGQFEQHQSL